MFKKGYMFFIILLAISPASGQEGLSRQLTLISNPAFAGIEGDGNLTISYLNLFPGNGLNLHSLNLSFDSFIPSIHGGAAIWLSDDYLGGIVNNVSGGFAYSYIFRAGDDLFFSAGLSGSVYHRGFDFRNALLPDQINPLGGLQFPSAETLSVRGKSVFDLGAGFLLISGRFWGGASVNHLTEPDPNAEGIGEGQLRRLLLIHGAGEFGKGDGKGFILQPAARITAGKEYFAAGAGLSISYTRLSLNIFLLGNNESDIDMQTGFTIRMASMRFFYNYRFNIYSVEKLLPFSLIHHTGIALGLNNVDKRKIIKTINFPNL
jgi:type IX secretion system PorP/SprF family membrane protein